MTRSLSAQSTSERADSVRANRRRMVEAAQRLFVRDGYAATTMSAIASESGMAVQTLYFTFGNKRTILQNVIDVCNAGDDEPVPILDRAWFREILDDSDGARQIRTYVRNARIIYERISLVLEVLRNAAAVDPELDAQWRTNQERYLVVLTSVAEAIAENGCLRDGVTVQKAAETMFGVLGHELFHVFVTRLGWTPEEWQQWAADTLCDQLVGA